MRKFIVTLVFLASCGTLAQGQHLCFGVKIGATGAGASMYGLKQTGVQHDFGIGFYAGGLAEFSLTKRSDKFKLQMEILYNRCDIPSVT